MPVALVNSLAAISHQVWSVLQMALRLLGWAEAGLTARLASKIQNAGSFIDINDSKKIRWYFERCGDGLAQNDSFGPK
jgi:hypothetical protein